MACTANERYTIANGDNGKMLPKVQKELFALDEDERKPNFVTGHGKMNQAFSVFSAAL